MIITSNGEDLLTSVKIIGSSMPSLQRVITSQLITSSIRPIKVIVK